MKIMHKTPDTSRHCWRGGEPRGARRSFASQSNDQITKEAPPTTTSHTHQAALTRARFDSSGIFTLEGCDIRKLRAKEVRAAAEGLKARAPLDTCTRGAKASNNTKSAVQKWQQCRVPNGREGRSTFKWMTST